MSKGTYAKFLRGRTSHRVTKLATLVASSAVLVAMINIDASASPSSLVVGGPTTAHSVESVSPRVTVASLRDHRPVTTAMPPGTPPSDLSGGPTTAAASTRAHAPSAPSTTTSAHGSPVSHPAADGPTTTSAPPTTTTTTTAAPTTTTTAASAIPVGVLDASEPSGYAPPSASALAGYTQSYVSDFTGSSLPSGWYAYSGTPGGDPGGQFGSAHVSVSNGLLSLNTYQDPAYNNEWVTGGLCQCGLPHTYGAFFVRSRVTGAGPTEVALLWPATNTWPHEIDFNESNGSSATSTATDLWAFSGGARSQVQSHVSIDLTQWHTWGVIWTPTSITYTVDGRVWGRVTDPSTIPSIPMTLDLQQQTWCSSGWACPSAPQSMQIDWVAEYSPNA